MLNLDQKPFTWLPFAGEDQLNATAEHVIVLLYNLDKQHDNIIGFAETYTQNIETANFFSTSQVLFPLIDGFLDSYSKLVRATKLSLGENVGVVKSKTTILSRGTYTPNTTLQSNVSHGIRNTAQHFEERLQDHYATIDPFSQIHYESLHPGWTLKFGKGGYTASSTYDKAAKNNFDEKCLTYESYKGNNPPLPIKINLHEVWIDILKIKKLYEDNLSAMIITKGICCPPVRGISIALVTQNGQ